MSSMQRSFVVFGLVFALAAWIPDAIAQGTNATCLPSFNWMTNSRQQSPCLVAAYLNTPCLDDPTDAFVVALPPDFHYRPPSVETATECQCSSVFYSALQACALCQGNPSVPWSTWNSNCTVAIFESVYPFNIPAGTAVPAWAYLNVSLTDNFDPLGAQGLANTDPTDSTATIPPTSTSALPSSSGTGSTPTSTLSPANGESTKSGGTNAAIAGGVVGGVIALALDVALVWWFLRRRNKKAAANPSAFDVTPYHDNANGKEGGLATPVSQQPISPTSFAPQFLPATPVTGRIYDPNDPSTFPQSPPQTSVNTTLYNPPSVTGTYAPTTGWSPAPGRYSGAPEL